MKIVLNRFEGYVRPKGMIPFEMIDEDLRVARTRAHRRDELARRRTTIAASVRESQHKLDAIAVWDQEDVAAEEARLRAYTGALAAVEQELADLGPAQELYDELLIREERRLIESADSRGAELLELGRLLAELDVELPAGIRARNTGRTLLHHQHQPLTHKPTRGTPPGATRDHTPETPPGATRDRTPETPTVATWGRADGLPDDVVQERAVGTSTRAGQEHAPGTSTGAVGECAVETSGGSARGGGRGAGVGSVCGGEFGAAGECEARAAFVREVAVLGMTVPDLADRSALSALVEELEERCRELRRLRDKLRARREELLLGSTHR
ncbi:hypothetical protein [Nonomuraea maritima]|uniref:hypothetical protein n=1 Tax=Nonomuraea maritima TaxID=683260 RepID=UPI00115FE615|nr:hypothetical protein [Nonomuraea maritima]